MDEIKDDWEVVVFTASCKAYADSIVNYLDPEGKYFPHRFYRESWWLTPENVYVKDLRIFHQWDLKDIILVDNAVYSFGFQLDNGIPIFPYLKGKEDRQLKYLKEYLKEISIKDIIPDLKKTFQMSYLYKCDIDSFLDYYDNEESDEDADDILDQMFNNEIFRRKALSFQSVPLIHKTRSYTENTFQSTEKDRWFDTLAVASDEIPRTFSGNVDEVRQHAELIDVQAIEAELHELGIDEESSESKQKPRRKKVKYWNMKKVKSEWVPLLSSEKYHKLIDPDVLKIDIPDTLKVDIPDALKIDIPDEESEEKLSRDNNSSQQTKPVKRNKRRKRQNKMKELKLGVSSEYDIYDDPINLETNPIANFAKDNNKEEIEDSNSSNSQKEDGESDYRIGPFSTGCINYIFKRENNLSRSAKVKAKRSPSPLNKEMSDSFKHSLNVQIMRKKSTTSSSSSCEDDLERDDESGNWTNWTSKNQYSHKSSVEMEKWCSYYQVSPFDNVIEADSDKESSPLPRKKAERKNSLMHELDIISKWVASSVNLIKTNSSITENHGKYILLNLHLIFIFITILNKCSLDF